MTIYVEDSDYTVGATDTVSGSDRLFQMGSNSLLNYGTISMQSSDNYLWIIGIQVVDSSLYEGQWFRNEAGAHADFSSTGNQVIVNGFFGGGWAPSFDNAGTFTVEAPNGMGTGVDAPYGYPILNVTNEGILDVTANEAWGIMVGLGIIDNSGTIDVEGDGSAVGVSGAGTFTNSGTIISNTSAYTLSTGVYGGSYTTFINSGTITADVAIEAATTLLTNTESGIINGALQLTDVYVTVDETVHNSGTINGDVHTGGGNDVFDGTGALHGTLYGGDGNDTLTGSSINDTIDGGAGNDAIDGSGGINTASYADATTGVIVNLALTGAQDTGGAGTDTLSHIQNLTGSGFDDTLTGDGGNNVIDGGAGNDVIAGGGGNDTIDGGSGTNTAAYSGNHDDHAVTDTGTNAYTVSDAGTATTDGTDTLTSVQQIQFSDGTFTYGATGPVSSVVTDSASQPWDTVGTSYDAAGSIETQSVFDDNGTLWVNTFDTTGTQTYAWKTDALDFGGHPVSELVTNHDGTHALTLYDNTNAYAWANATISFDASWNMTGVTGTNDNGSHTVTMANIEAAYDDAQWFITPYDPNTGAVTAQGLILAGGGNADYLYGHAGDDALVGGAGNDLLSGGGGDDTLSGGTGDDRFVFHNGDGLDTITDFTAGNSSGDVIELHGYGVSTFASLQGLMSQVGSDTVIAFDPDNVVTLHNVTMSQLNSGDFVLS